jgi:hypothetical protein
MMITLRGSFTTTQNLSEVSGWVLASTDPRCAAFPATGRDYPPRRRPLRSRDPASHRPGRQGSATRSKVRKVPVGQVGLTTNTSTKDGSSGVGSTMTVAG